jgi:hypothetical protein
MSESTDMWALVELMGHSRIVGKLTEANLAGGAFLRVDVPGEEWRPAITKFYSPSAVYAITPVTEAEAKAMIEQISPKPVALFQSPLLSEKVGSDSDDDDDDDREYEGDDRP